MAKAIPRCFTSRRQFELWVAAARVEAPGGSAYCTDCTPAYQRRMVTQQRCAYPRTRFCRDSEGFIEGRRPVEERMRALEAA